MKKTMLFLALLAVTGIAFGDTPPARVINAELYDAAGNAISSTGGSLNVETTSSALPAGAATETTLSNLNGKFNSLGQKVMSASVPVTVSSDQSPLPVTQSGTWFSRITDGTNTAAVKAAATAPTTADPALVVGISPNSPITVTSVPPVNNHVTGTLTAACASGVSCTAGSTVQVTTDGYSTVGYETHGTWSAAVTTDVSFDPLCSATPNAVLWYNTASIDTDTNESVYVNTWGTARNNDPWVMNVASAQCARVRASAYTSGTVDVTIDTGVGTSMVWAVDVGNAASGSADSGNPVKVGGVYKLSPPVLTDGARSDLLVDSTGNLLTALPVDAATETTLSAINTKLTTTGNGLKVDVQASALPTGAATSALQTTGNSSLSSIDGKVHAFDLDTGAGTENNQGVSLRFAASGGSVAAGTSSNPLRTDPTGTTTQPVSVTTSALPTGAATEATLSALNTKVTTSASGILVDGSTVTQPISASALPLPLGASTEATLAALSAKFNSLGQKTSANSAPVVLASDQSAIPVSESGTWNITNITGTVSLPTGAATSALQTTGNSSLSSIDTKTPALVGGRVPVDASGVTVTVSGTVTANIGTTNGLALDATVANPQGSVGGGTAGTKSNLAGGVFNTSFPTLTNGQQAAVQLDSSARLVIRPLTSADVVTANQGGTWNITNITGTVPLPTGAATSALQTTGNSSLSSIDGKTLTAGQKTSANSYPVVLASDQSAIPVSESGTWNITNISGTVSLPTGASTSALQTTGNSSLATISGQLPATLGQKAMAAGLAVTIASDQSAVPASQSGTWNINNISGTVSLPTGAATAANQTTINTSVQEVHGTVAAGAAATKSDLIGLVFNTALPTLTNGQQAAAQADSSGRLLIGALPTGANTIGAVTQASGPWTQNITQFGSAAVATGTGASGSGIPRVTVANDSNILATQSGTWTTGRTWNLSSGADSVAATESGTWTVQQGATATTNANGWAVKPGDGTNTQGYTASNEAKVLVTPLTNSSVVKAQLQDNAGTAITLGQKAMASSVPVALASDQASIPVTQSAGPWTQNLTQVGGVALALGQAAAASSVPVVTQADAAPATQNVTTQDLVTATAAGANGQNFMTGTPTANSAATFALSSWDSLEVQVTGTWTGTMVTEASMDGGTTWYTRGIKQGGVPYIASSFTANFAGGMNVSGMTNFRVRATAAVTGTATVKVTQSVNNGAVTVTNALQLRDSTTQTISDTIKAASTAAIATDTALVVTIGPNTPLPAGTNVLGALSANQSINLVQVNGATESATNPLFTKLTDGTNAAGAFVSATNAQITVSTPGQLPPRLSLDAGWDGTTHREVAVDTSGNQVVVGNAASASADSGAPVKVGGVFNTTPPALTNGQRGDFQVDQFGNVAMTTNVHASFRHQSSAATATLKSGAGRLIRVCLNTNGANGHTITLWDNTAASGTVIAVITTAAGSAVGACGQYDLYFSTGLTFTTSSTDDWTIVYE